MRVTPDGSLMQDGQKVGRLVNSGRRLPQYRNGTSLGECVVHGFAVHNLDGVECFWAGHFGDALAMAEWSLERMARKREAA